MAEENDERTEEATQSRRDEFRSQGQVPHSKEFASALFLLACSGLVYGLSQFFFRELSELFRQNYGAETIRQARSGDLFTALNFAGSKIFILLGPVFGIAVVLGVAANVLQTGFMTVEDALSMDLNKINPLEGMKRLFALRNLVEGFKAFLKMLLIGFVVYLLLKKEVVKMPMMMQYTTEEIARYIGAIVVKLFGGIGVAMGILAGIDYFYQRWDIEKRMMMTKQEIKEEMKGRELDPQIKARIRRTQREMASKRMMQDVPKADVIVTNPTHIAIALKYGNDLPAPQLIAKGSDLVAERIKALAKEHNIPIIENKPLARTIFKTMKIGQVIPRELYVAVAEVLSFVFKLRRKSKGRI